MTIARMAGGAPRIDVQANGEIGLYAVDDAEPDPDKRYLGFLFDRATALAVALRLIATLQQDGAGPMLELRSFEGGIVSEPGRPAYAHLRLGIEGASFPVYLDRPDLARLVADLSALLRDLE